MLLFLKGILIGIGKIIPGVSGAMLAINFNIYERALNSVTHFFDDWKDNLKFILLCGSGIILSMILCSGMIQYFLNNYFFVTMMFFIGLILGGTYSFSLSIKYNYKNILVIFLVIVLFLFVSLGNFNNLYVIKNNFFDNVIFFIGGIIEIMASVIPGISGTALLMLIGIYDNVLELISSLFNYSYVIDNINLYLSYGIGMFISFIVSSYLLVYLINKYKNYTYSVILGLSISSIILLIIMAFIKPFSIIEFILGIMLLFIGILISCIFSK